MLPITGIEPSIPSAKHHWWSSHYRATSHCYFSCWNIFFTFVMNPKTQQMNVIH